MNIRFAQPRDIPRLGELLEQVKDRGNAGQG